MASYLLRKSFSLISRINVARVICIRGKLKRTYCQWHRSRISSEIPLINNKSFPLYAGLMTWLGFKKKEEEEEEDPLITTIKLGILSFQKEDYNIAEQTLHLALKIAQERADPQAELYVFDILANVALQKEDYPKSEKLFREVTRRLLLQGKADDDDAIIEISLKLSKIYSKLHNDAKAVNGFKYCIDVQQKKIEKLQLSDEKELTEDEKNTLALWGMGVDWYARHLMDRGNLEDAQLCFEKALDVSERINGLSHPQTLVLINDIGSLASVRNNFQFAIDHFNKAIQRAKGTDTPDLPAFYCNLGATYIKQGEFQRARSACESAMRLAKKFKNKAAAEDAEKCLEEVMSLKT